MDSIANSSLRSFTATNIMVCHDVTCHAVLIAGSLAQHLATGQTASRFNLRRANFQKFSGGHALRPPSKSMLCMLSVLCTLSKLRRPTLCQTLHFLSLNFAATIMLTIYERPNLSQPPP